MLNGNSKISAIIFMISLLGSSCSSAATNTANSAPATEDTELPALNPTSIPTQIPAGKATSVPFLTYQCLEVAPNLPKDARPQGLLVLQTANPFLLNLETGVKKPLKDGQWNFSTSPNGRWLASQYVDDDQNIWLLVESADGKQQKQIRGNDDWFLLSWLDNDQVWISHRTKPILTVINPFTGTQKELVPDFPGFETAAQAGEHFALGASPVAYNSSLNYAIYPRLESDGYVYVVLWDRQANRVLAKVKDLFKSFEYEPIWSLDQKQIYVAVGDKQGGNQPNDLIQDFFSLNQDGQVKQLTDFGTLFSETYILSPSISPDGKKIAFWLYAQPGSDKGRQLAVLDLASRQVTDYCVNDPSPTWSKPIWSLDSRYLAVQNQYEPNAGRAILVDTQQRWAAIVAELIPNGWPEGWMVSP